MQAVQGAVPPAAQAGLGAAQVERGLFLACQCFPREDLRVARVDETLGRHAARVSRRVALAPDVLGLHLEVDPPFAYRAGQFLRLYRDAASARHYSLASVPGRDRALELHVRRVPGGQVSNWIFDELATGDTIQVSGAAGNCHYVPGRPDQPLLLIGTGCGLAPLQGVARDALHHGHRGPIRLYHGSRTRSGLYGDSTLRALAAAAANFRYTPCVHGHAGAPAQADRHEAPLPCAR